MNQSDVLKYAVDHDMIDLQRIQQQIEMDKRIAILKKHPYSILYSKTKRRWYTRFDTDNGVVQRTKNTRTELEALIVNFYENDCHFEEVVETYTFAQAHDRWLEMQWEYGKEDNTIFRYEADWRRFFSGTAFSRMDILTMTSRDIETFMINRIKDLNLKRQAGVTLYGYINGVFYNAVMDRKIPRDAHPCDYVDKKKFKRYYNRDTTPSAQRVFSQEEINQLVKRLNYDVMERPTCLSPYGVRLALLTGMRSGEICGLRWSHIDQNSITICESEKFDQHKKRYFVSDTKTGKDRTMPITDGLRSFLNDMKVLQNKYGITEDFVISTGEGKLHTRNLSDYMIKACKKLEFGCVKNIHAIRRTFNSYLRQSGTSATIAGSIIGNSSVVNTNHYTYDVCDLGIKKKLVEDAEQCIIANYSFAGFAQNAQAKAQ